MAKLFLPASPAAIRNRILEDYQLAALQFDIDVPISPGSDSHIWATADANVAYLQYGNIARIEPSLTPLNSTGDDLERWRVALGVPEQEPTPALGKIRLTVTGTSTVTDGSRFTIKKNGIRGKVIGNWVGVTDNSEIDVETIDTGDEANADPDEEVVFTNPPANVATVAHVSKSEPLRGGTSKESEARKRDRIRNKLELIPGSGNAGHLRDVAFRASPIVQQVYVYPAAGGPSTGKVTLLRAYDRSLNSFTRALTSAQQSFVRAKIHAEVPIENEIPVETVTDVETDVSIQVTIPDSPLAGGNGTGWLDASPWPPLDGGDTRVTVTTVTSSINITVNASTTTSPVAGLTRVAWWNKTDKKFETRIVTAVSGSSGAWVLTLDRPLVDSGAAPVSTTDYICPAAKNLVAYGNTWTDLMGNLGAGELTADANRLPRSLRIPSVNDETPENIGAVQLLELKQQYVEISDIQYAYRENTAPAVPASVGSNPNVLTIGNLGIYPI